MNAPGLSCLSCLWRPLFALLTLAATAATAQAPAAGAGIEGLAWLGGCWRAEGGEAGSGEHWLPLAGHTLMGVSRTVRQGRTVDFEFMQVRQLADGSVVFAAQPRGRTETLFTLRPGALREAVFENLAHDFPQRVIYRLEDGGRLRARVEGERDGRLRGIDFPLQRVPCEALAGAAHK
jgi:Domain of unknown function (DUF6265)